jgi:cation:H+ antiporter
MTAAIIQFLVSSTVVVIAAVVLTRCADRFARLTGLGHLIVGIVFLAAATSLPEFSVNWSIIRLGFSNMAVGGLIGSSLFNLAILAIADLLHKQRRVAFSRKSVEHALSGMVSIAMTMVVGIGVFVGARLGAWEVGGVGVFSIVMSFTYLFGMRLIYHDQLSDRAIPPPGNVGSKVSFRSPAILRAAAGFMLAAIVILVAAPWSASAAAMIAELSGLGNTFVGTTLVALATSLPELVACVAAARIGAMNLAIGNVFGSNSFNLLLLVPLDAAWPGSLMGSVSITHLLTCLLVVLTTSVVIIGQLYRVESRKFLVEPDAALVLLLVAGGLVLIYYCR